MITDSQIAAMSLSEYLAALNAPARAEFEANPEGFCCFLCEDLSHWAGYGITTAPQLADYLDREAAHEAAKEARYEYYNQDDQDEALIEDHEEREYYDDCLTDAEADAMTLASAGMGTDEDYFSGSFEK
jgi:hypothetical protein